MNTGKQINAMVVVLFLTLIAVGAYTIWDPFRSEEAEDAQLEKSGDFGAQVFALNCRLCHGDRGEGGAAGGRLLAAAMLDRPGLQGIKDGVFTQAEFDSNFRLVTNTITCGRAGTAMPTWGASQGGTLNDEQVRQLAILITGGDPALGLYREGAFWELAQEHADAADAEATDHATVEMPDGSLAAGDTELIVSNAGPFTLGQYVRIGEERLRVLPIGLEVARAVDGTTAAEHRRGVPVLLNGQEVLVRPSSEEVVVLSEPVDDEVTLVPVSNTDHFSVGDTLQIEDERMRVTGITAGIPSTEQVLVKDVGREPRRLLVSGAAGIEEGDLIRIDGELMEVKAVRDDGDADIELDDDASTSATEISVSEPTFFREGYLFRVGDEWMEVVDPVETGQTLDATVGRAQTVMSTSGTEGIEEGMIVRIDGELLRVVDIVQPARVEIERAQDDTAAASHAAGATVLKVVEEPEEGEEPEDPRTGQTLFEAAGADDGTIVMSGITRIAVDEQYRLGDEVVLVTRVLPAVLRVQRAVDGTVRAEHSRRAPLFDGNLIEVERGAQGTASAAHEAGDGVLFTEIEVKRAAEGSEHQEHAKNAELFLGNRLIVARGVRNTQPADHENGELVRNFPTAPEEPTRTMEACGQVEQEGTGPAPTPPAGAQEVQVALAEFSVTADPTSAVTGSISFTVMNEGDTSHNFRVIATDLAADELPMTGSEVDEEADDLEVVGGFTGALRPGNSQAVPLGLEAGNYVLICNVPTHYEQGMYTGFEVTP